jgi:hypothetical protein
MISSAPLALRLHYEGGTGVIIGSPSSIAFPFVPPAIGLAPPQLPAHGSKSIEPLTIKNVPGGFCGSQLFDAQLSLRAKTFEPPSIQTLMTGEVWMSISDPFTYREKVIPVVFVNIFSHYFIEGCVT